MRLRGAPGRVAPATAGGAAIVAPLAAAETGAFASASAAPSTRSSR